MMKLRSREFGKHQLLNPEFKYVPAAATDVRATFNRAREEQERQRLADEAERRAKVRTMVKPRGQ
jgi:hypothetical protein